jgi:ectoine hydroxylase-related dioxygenase (phytanoyl-CoA dioxygenase family)
MILISSLRNQVFRDGFAMVEDVLGDEKIEILLSSLDTLDESNSILRRGGVFAARNLLEISPEIRALADSLAIRDIVTPVLGESAFPVRGILFDKTQGANWKVPWHQDLTIAVAGRAEVEGFGPWSIKAGVQHVQAPAAILENMLSVRIHLDDCGSENGALKVIASSHKRGRLRECDAMRLGANGPVAVCSVEAGDVVLMRPLLIHSSSACEMPAHRRVIHLDFASGRLPGQLKRLGEEC